jgi:hypothetical protein
LFILLKLLGVSVIEFEKLLLCPQGIFQKA